MIDLERTAVAFLDRLTREFADQGRDLAAVDPIEREEVERRLIEHVALRVPQERWPGTAYLLFEAAQRAREIEEGRPPTRPAVVN